MKSQKVSGSHKAVACAQRNEADSHKVENVSRETLQIVQIEMPRDNETHNLTGLFPHDLADY